MQRLKSNGKAFSTIFTCNTSAYPYSVAQFKALTDIGTATMAFEANFERPAVTHPERIDMA
ncbi:hypothetical protein DBN73_17750, partial [Enterococcus faecalis]|uniref:hypothetical protein n=1 Tax=Enterococcus faecalis TaxID=1351 RepID=UPI0020B8260D